MNIILNKFKQKEFMQNLVIEVAGDIIMLILGLIFAYYFKIMFFA